jgi:DNA-binding CsgD family transcriptional regulator
MNMNTILDMIFKENRTYFKDYKEDIVPRSDGYINEFSKNEKSVKIIFDHVNFKILNISDNTEALSGHSAEKLRNSGIGTFVKFVVLEHALFLYYWQRWFNEITTKHGIMQDINITFCGVKIKHKNGHTMRLMFRLSGLEFMENGAITVSIVSIDDVSHLIKSDFYWGRMEFGKDERHIHHLVSKDKKDVAQDIISDREKDVLSLLIQGKESKEIGAILFISQHTVDNHRRSMIAKTGARDTTGLVQICRMAGVI